MLSSLFMQNSKAIDIVYLWVDGNAPEWRSKRRSAADKLSASHRMAMYGNVEGRFRDNDELRYSLRALERFFPEHGHIYIVTDNQKPAWLRTSNRLTIIDHTDLIPGRCLPVFDSGNIESYIHRIPGLSERYFYLNDDVFFGAPVKVSDWFWEGGIYTAWSDEAEVSDEPPRQDATAHENACRLSKLWFSAQLKKQAMPIHALHYKHMFRTFAHAPRPMLKSLLFDLEDFAPEIFASARSTVFRTWDKPCIVSDFVMRWAMARGLAKPRDYTHLYISAGEADQTAQLELLASSMGALEFFCINDITDDALPHDARLTEVRAALQGMFSRASSFECTVPRDKKRECYVASIANVQLHESEGVSAKNCDELTLPH
jgi:Stealth protein CR2, conserved region 2/Stealth protein CR1, conserved region 1